MTRKYDSTIARIAGNLLSGVASQIQTDQEMQRAIWNAVRIARLIVKETERTEPQPQPEKEQA